MRSQPSVLTSRCYGQGHIAKALAGERVLIQFQSGESYPFGRSASLLNSSYGASLGQPNLNIAGKLAFGIEIAGHGRMGRKQYAAKVVLYGRQAILADGPVPVPPLHPGYNACPTGNECCSPCPCTAR